MELSQLELGGKKGYPICTYCHGNGFDVVTHGKAVQTSKDQWTRKFGDASKPTVVSWDNAKHIGSIKWAHEY